MPTIVELIKTNSTLPSGTIIGLLKNPKSGTGVGNCELSYGSVIPLYSNVVADNIHVVGVEHSINNPIDISYGQDSVEVVTTTKIHNIIMTTIKHEVCLNE